MTTYTPWRPTRLPFFYRDRRGMPMFTVVKGVRFSTELPEPDEDATPAPTCDDQWDEMSEEERATYVDDHGPGIR